MKVSIKNAKRYEWGAGCEGWHLVNRPELSVIEERMPPGAQEVNHSHEKSRQLFYVLSGTAVMDLDGADVELDAGEGIEVAPGAKHQIRNPGPGDLKLIVVSHPHSHGDRVVAS